MTVNETASDLTDEWAASWLRDTSKVGFILLLSVILVVACFGKLNKSKLFYMFSY